MLHLLKTNIGRLRIIGFLEGVSLLILLFIAVPLKYFGHDPSLVKGLGPVHGALFLLFVVNSISVGVEQKWQFKTTWKVLLACMVPFGTFYIDKTILSKQINKA
jgi:integral membrane protein